MKRIAIGGTIVVLGAVLLSARAAGQSDAPPLPDWASKIRTDHPRLFFNRHTWPDVRRRALGAENDWFRQIKAGVDKLQGETSAESAIEPRDLGAKSARAAFVYLVTGERRYLDLAKKALVASLAFYEQCYAERKSVHWYSNTRAHAAMTWDWLHNDLTEAERREYMSRLVKVLHNVYTARPGIPRENLSGHKTGFYGAPNCKWFVGCTALGTGIEENLVRRWLVWGRDENLKMLAHRRKACGDDGGAASPTACYAFYAYPWAENNFLYTWLSATGENIAADWPHAAYLANYLLWSWIPAGGRPLEYGYGDTHHYDNELDASELFGHMANIRHLYGEAVPEAAAAARYVQQSLPRKKYSKAWFIYPFLIDDLDESLPPFDPKRLPHARHFERMGQVFMRSGVGEGDTYCLFTCGGILGQHRHYDALNFVIYHRGYLALDSGTRHLAEVLTRPNGLHLVNYYAQTVAHNCILVHQPGEPPVHYWSRSVGDAKIHYGGQHRALGSTVEAFETNDRFVYVAGDGTACYRHGPVKREGKPDLPEKVSQVTRQIVYLIPNHFIVFDRVRATDPSYKKDWLLHLAHEPTIDGKTFRADHRGGRIFCRTLLPADAALTPVGGPGKEFSAAGKNWNIVKRGLSPEHLAMMGRWRVEVSPAAPRRADCFLHLIQVGERTLDAMDPAEPIRAARSAGLRLKTGRRTWEVAFNTEGELGGRIKLSGDRSPIDRPLSDKVAPQAGFYQRRE